MNPSLNGHGVARESRIAEAIQGNLEATIEAAGALSGVRLTAITERVLLTYEARGHVYIFGNGGSATTAEHFACDLIKAASTRGPHPLRVACLSSNTAVMTALANDLAYEEVFAAQVDGQITSRDVAIAISASGNSPNVIRGIEVARRADAFTIGLLGFGGGRLRDLVDLAVVVRSDDYGVVENVHLAIEHAVTAAFKTALMGEVHDSVDDDAIAYAPRIG